MRIKYAIYRSSAPNFPEYSPALPFPDEGSFRSRIFAVWRRRVAIWRHGGHSTGSLRGGSGEES